MPKPTAPSAQRMVEYFVHQIRASAPSIRKVVRTNYAVRTQRVLLGLLILLVGIHPLQAEQINWRKDMVEALKESDRVKKPVLMTITASWCGYCKKMKRTNIHLSPRIYIVI